MANRAECLQNIRMKQSVPFVARSCLATASSVCGTVYLAEADRLQVSHAPNLTYVVRVSHHLEVLLVSDIDTKRQVIRRSTKYILHIPFSQSLITYHLIQDHLILIDRVRGAVIPDWRRHQNVSAKSQGPSSHLAVIRHPGAFCHK